MQQMNGERADRYIYLADKPELLPTLADWFYDEWGRNNARMSPERMRSVLEEFLNTDKIPLTIITMRNSEPIGSATLKIQEMETHRQYLYWLGGVYVHPQYRRQGVGSRLVNYTAAKAKSLEVEELYLYTRSHEGFYARLGWQVIERPLYHERSATIMKRNLSVNHQKEENHE